MAAEKLLIIDDDPFIVRPLMLVLKRQGYRVDSARDGEAGVAKVLALHPAVVFLDVMMPKKDGYEVCQEIRNNPDLQDVYIIMLTAKGQESDAEKSIEVGANEYMAKPFRPSDVLARVKEILAGRESST